MKEHEEELSTAELVNLQEMQHTEVLHQLSSEEETEPEEPTTMSKIKALVISEKVQTFVKNN